MEKKRIVSQTIYADSCHCFPGGVNSPVRAFTGLERDPLVVERGEGSCIWDADGNPYIDYCGSWGALILGHAPKSVVQAAIDQLYKGSSFGIMTPYELELGKCLQKHLPHMEKLRFVSSGTEAVMSAVRLARGVTGRSLLVKFNGHYHGHLDSLLVKAGSGVSHLPMSSSLGIPKELVQHTVSLPFNDRETVKQFLRSHPETAAVILEPIAGNMGLVPADFSFLQMLKEETAKIGALLIFDEVISGFRVGLQGASGLYGLFPDLTCLGKIIGGGFPAAAFGGKKEIMDHLAPLGGVYQAGTLSGNPIAMCAGLATLKELEKKGFYEELEAKADFFLNPIRKKIKERNLPVTLNQVGSAFTLFFGVRGVYSSCDLEKIDLPCFKRFFQFLFDSGIYFPPSQYETAFISSAHTEEDLLKTQKCILLFLDQEYS